MLFLHLDGVGLSRRAHRASAFACQEHSSALGAELCFARTARGAPLHAPAILLARMPESQRVPDQGAAQDRYFEAIPSRSILRLRASTNSMLRRRYSL
jgi:hypothetical protein